MSIDLHDLSEKLRSLQNRINELESQWAVSKVNTFDIYQFLSGATAQGMNLEDVNLGGNTSDDSDASHTGTQVFHSTVELKAAVDAEADVNFWKTDARDEGTKIDGSSITLSDVDSNTSVITRPAGATDQIEYSGNLKVVVGEFAGTTVKIGTQVLSEDAGQLKVVEGGIRASHTTDSSWDGIESVADINDLSGGKTVYGMKVDVSTVDQTNDPNIYGLQVQSLHDTTAGNAYAGKFISANKIVYLCDKTYTIWVDQGDVLFDNQVNFAGGTYKIEADGDAFFKHLFLSSLELRDSQINEVLTDTDSAGILVNFDGYQSGNTRFRDLSIYDGKRAIMIHVDGSGPRMRTFATRVSFGDGETTNYAQFAAADGELTLHGTARVTKEVVIANAALERGATAPDFVAIDNFNGFSYSIGDDSIMTLVVPDDWASGTNISVVAHWYINEDYAGADKEVKWTIDYSLVPHNETELMDAPTHTGTLTATSQNIPTNAKELTKTTIGAIPSGSIAVGDELGLTFTRIAADNDDPTADPVVIHLALEYIADKLGIAT